MSQIPPLGAHPFDDVAVHAVDAGDPADGAGRWVLDTHLARCPACRAELDMAHATVARLVRPAAPPVYLWARITATLPLPVAGGTHGGTNGGGGGRGLAGARSGGAGVGEPVAPVPVRRRTRALLAAAAVAVAVVGAAGLVVARAGDGSSAPGVVALAEAALADPGHPRVALTSPAGDRVARVVADDDAGVGFVLLDGLAPLPAGRAYQLWRVDDPAAAVSLGVLGDGTAAVQAVPLPPGASRLVITAEPAGGTIRPTGPLVARGTLPPPVPTEPVPTEPVPPGGSLRRTS
jgi:hypothetical protein